MHFIFEPAEIGHIILELCSWREKFNIAGFSDAIAHG